MFPLLFSETGLRDSHALKTYNKPQGASFIILLIFHLRNLTFSEVKSILLGSGSKLRSDYSKKKPHGSYPQETSCGVRICKTLFIISYKIQLMWLYSDNICYMRSGQGKVNWVCIIRKNYHKGFQINSGNGICDFVILWLLVKTWWAAFNLEWWIGA